MKSIDWKNARWILPASILLLIACVGISQEGGDDDDDGDEVVKSINDVPAPVREAAVKYCGNEIKAISKEKDGGEILFEFEYVANGSPAAAVFSDRGVLCSVEHTIPATSMPKSMTEEIQKRYPGATIDRAETTEVHGYEVRLIVGGKHTSVEATASGHLAGGKGEEGEEGEEDEENEAHEGGHK